MSHLSPDHVTGASTTTGELSADRPSNGTTLNFSKKRVRRSRTSRPTDLLRQTSPSDDETLDPAAQTEERGRKKVFFSSNLGQSNADPQMYYLPHQNLDASSHAPFYSSAPIPIPFYGNPSCSPHMFVPGNGNRPPPPQMFPHGNYSHPQQYYQNIPMDASGSSYQQQLVPQQFSHQSPPHTPALGSDPTVALATASHTNASKANSKEKHTSYATAAKYAMGKPVYNLDLASGPAYHSLNDLALIYNITALQAVPDNQIVSTVSIQIGPVLEGAKMKYSKGKRTHLELVFCSIEALNSWKDKSLTIIGRNLKGLEPSSVKRSFLSLSLSGMPLGNKQKTAEATKEVFDKYGLVITIKPKLWEGTTIASDKWMVTMDTTDSDDLITFTNKLPRSVNVLDEKVFVTWKSAPAYCTFCKKSGHKRSQCKDLVLADSSVLTQPDLSDLSQEPQPEKMDDSTPPTQPENDSQQIPQPQEQAESSQTQLPTRMD